MRLQQTLAVFLLGIVRVNWPTAEGKAMDREPVDPLQKLTTFKGINDYDFTFGPAGVYAFYYSLPQSSRYEERSGSGEVKGNYAYVAPEGDEFKFKYEAGKKGFQVESNALPIAPEDTDEVKEAKAAFFQAYQQQLALTEDEDEAYGRKKPSGEKKKDEKEEEDEEEEDEDEEESSEEDDDDDEESSEEDDDEKEDDDDEESSEEDDDEEEEEEDEEEEEEGKEKKHDDEAGEKSKKDDYTPSSLGGKKKSSSSSSFQIPNYIYKSRPRTSYSTQKTLQPQVAQKGLTHSALSYNAQRPFASKKVATYSPQPQKNSRNNRALVRRVRRTRGPQLVPQRLS